MNLKVYTVYDCKVEAYMRPFLLQTKGEALRSWMHVVNDPKTQFNKNPEDFTLFEIGEYDDHTAKLTSHATPVSIATALEVINKETH